MKKHSILLIMVNDGSNDKTLEKIEEFNCSFKYKIINLSRNYGHQAAVWAGIENSDLNSHTVVLDSDLQDPPSLIPEIFQKLMGGFDVVLMKRRSRIDGYWKKFFANFYYKVYSLLSGNADTASIGDFYGISPRAKRALLSHKESIKYLRGLIQNIGFPSTLIEYDRQPRLAGTTHYSISQMFSLAVAGVTGFSLKPLILVIYFAFGGSLLAFLGSIYVVLLKINESLKSQPGFAFLAVSILFFFSVVLLSLAILALYLARLVQEIKKRPIYLIDNIIGNENV